MRGKVVGEVAETRELIYRTECFVQEPGCEGVTEHRLDPRAFTRWQHGELIQRAFPNMPVERREQLISGTCPGCWKALFEEDTEDFQDQGTQD